MEFKNMESMMGGQNEKMQELKNRKAQIEQELSFSWTDRGTNADGEQYGKDGIMTQEGWMQRHSELQQEWMKVTNELKDLGQPVETDIAEFEQKYNKAA
jgi:hypothetical protein